MIGFLDQIVGTIVSLFQLIVTSVTSFLRLIQVVFDFVTFGTTAIAYFPSPLVVFVSLGITTSVIFFLVGR